MAEIIETVSEYAPAIQNDGSKVVHECGTVCCIAGAIVQFELQDQLGTMAGGLHEAQTKYRKFLVDESIIDTAARIADISRVMANNLFIPTVPLDRATPAQGAKVIRDLIETGRVTWLEQDFPAPPVAGL
jgi:hypothetical protein